MRRRSLLALLAAAAAHPAARAAAEGGAGERGAAEGGAAGADLLLRWIAGFRPKALDAGIRPEVFDRAAGGLRFLPEVVRLDRRQNEFTRTIWDYLDRAVSADRIAAGQRALERHGPLLAAIARHSGVEAPVLAAIWGIESAYGAVRGDVPTLSAVATLAADGRRGAFFEGEMIAALRILQSGVVAEPRMVGSWAGAMGHMQFLPTSYLRHAVDHDGDGRCDIWSDDPGDAIATAAAFLARHGWRPGQPWGLEVRLPGGFDYRLARDTNRQPVAYWSGLGLRTADGGPLPDHGAAVVLVPAGAGGPAFLTFRNFTVLENYNTADAYVIAVGHLADRLAGAGPFVGQWPRGDRALTLEERLELQRRLRDAGFDPRAIDGRIGPLTIAAVRAWQGARGLVPDGYASPAVLAMLRDEAPAP